MVLAANAAMESIGFKRFGFADARADDWEPKIVNWGKRLSGLAMINLIR